MQNYKFIKACNFYVSKWHLFAALLPYLKSELKSRNRVLIISEDNLQEGLKELVSKIDIKFENANGMDDIDWLSEEFAFEIREGDEVVSVIVQGSVQFLDEINLYLEKKFVGANNDIRIINCYEVYDSSNMLYDILDKHDYVFNTGGMHDKKEIFPEYFKDRANTINH